MKYIFVVHSHISFYGALSVIDYRKIEKTNIIFITARHYKNCLLQKYISYDMSGFHDSTKNIKKYDFRSVGKFISEFDNDFNQYVSESYCLFISHFNNIFFQLFVTHPLCMQVSIIEEGVNHLSKKLFKFNNHGFRNQIKKLFIQVIGKSFLYGRNRFFKIQHHLDFHFYTSKLEISKVNIYGFVENPFPHFNSPNKYCINFYIDERVEFMIPSKSDVLILEGAVEQGNLSMNTLVLGIKEILKHINNDCIFIKFHPAQSKSNREKITSLIRKIGLSVKIIPDTVSMEQIFLKEKDLRVHGFTSSLLYYAKLGKQKVFSYEKCLLHDEKFRKFRNLNDFNLEEILLQP